MDAAAEKGAKEKPHQGKIWKVKSNMTFGDATAALIEPKSSGTLASACAWFRLSGMIPTASQLLFW